MSLTSLGFKITEKLLEWADYRVREGSGTLGWSNRAVRQTQPPSSQG